MIENTMGEEALTRYSCWFALEHAVKTDGGAQWYDIMRELVRTMETYSQWERNINPITSTGY